VNPIKQEPSNEDLFTLRTDLIVSRANELRHHVDRIVTSRAFSRSRRSCEFLQHLLNKTLAGQHDELKERMIGMQLFGRDPAYDTGEDAIVRVTATDVRRRLKRFYDDVETDIRLDLPPGAYVIEFVEQAAPPEVPHPPQPSEPEEIPQPLATRSSIWRRLLPVAMALMVLGLLASVYHYRMPSTKADRLPWVAMLPRREQLKIVFSDPDIVALQGLTGSAISLTDYADHRYLPTQQLLDHPSSVIERLFKGYNVPMIDADFALSVRSLLPSGPINTYRARALQSQDFKTEDNFILLGSPVSDPWVALFQDRLDFYFTYDPTRHEEIINNRRVGHGETSVYAPTSPGWGTGQAFAIIGLLENPNQTGHVLILAGSNAVATEAAYRLVTDVDSIDRVLQEHGIDVYDRNAQFEILLRVNTMASSLDTFEVVACHRLPETGH
jgi:hypothetical protein